MEKRMKSSDMTSYLQLQMMLYKLKTGKMDFVTKMMKQIKSKAAINDDNEAANVVNFRMKKYLERNISK